MTMWADNIKFVKEIIDSKYSKIDLAVAEVNKWSELKYAWPYYLHQLTTFDFLSYIISSGIIHFQQNCLKLLIMSRLLRVLRPCWKMPTAPSRRSTSGLAWELWSWSGLRTSVHYWTQSSVWVRTALFVK